MKKNTNIRNVIIVMLGTTVILMGLGFLFLASKLDETKKEVNTFDVIITKVDAKTPIKGGIIDPTATKEITDEGKSIKFNFTLNNPKDELSYELTVKNVGNVPAKIIRVIKTPDYIDDSRVKSLIDPVTITTTKLENKILNPDETTTIKILVTYNMTNESRRISIPYQLTVLAKNNL